MKTLPLFLALMAAARAGQYIEAEFPSKIVPGPVPYAVLLPDGYSAEGPALPLFFNLHGGGGNRDHLKNTRVHFENLWKDGRLPKMVVVTPSASRSFYMDYRDGSQKWESFVQTEFLEHLRSKYNVRKDPKGTFLFGISMGGLGTLRMAFKHPENFAAAIAMEPGIDAALKWKEVLPRNKFWRSATLMESIFGKPFDEAYWEANNPASIAFKNADAIRASKLPIYLDVGDLDGYNLDEAAEFMHQLLWKLKIRHEYHLIYGADHVGASMKTRIPEALLFVNHVLNPPPPDSAAEEMRKRLAPLKPKDPR